MRLAFLAVGDEILRGETREANGAALAEILSERGLLLSELRIVGDEQDLIAAAIAGLTREPTVVVISGGLGPTDDDRTREAVSQAIGRPLSLDAGAAAAIRARAMAHGRSVETADLRQAYLPIGATLLENAHGTAPGFLIRHGHSMISAFPGVPREFRAMIEDHLATLVRGLGVPRLLPHRATLRIFGITESALQARLSQMEHYGDVELRSLPAFPEIRLRIAADERAELLAFLEEARRSLGWHLWSEDPEASYASVVLDRLRLGGHSLAVAESCTGGLIGHLLTQEPGCSEVLRAGVIAYANEAKARLLGVPEDLIAREGAVSEAVALAMAQGAREATGASVSLATTGIAGPGGGTAEKPVGTIWIALCTPERSEARRYRFQGLDRRRMKTLFAMTALAEIIRGV